MHIDEPNFFEDIDTRIDFCSEVDAYLAGVDLAKQKVILSDGSVLSIEQAADHIAKATQLDRDEILERVVNWLLMEYMPKGLNSQEMRVFKAEVERWTAPYE